MFYEKYKTIDFLYDYRCKPIQSRSLFVQEKKQIKVDETRKVTNDFYNGFGYDIKV